MMKANIPKQPTNRTLYECDPAKNRFCNKNGCRCNGGECHLTVHVVFAKHPIKQYRVPCIQRSAAEEAKLKKADELLKAQDCEKLTREVLSATENSNLNSCDPDAIVKLKDKYKQLTNTKDSNSNTVE